MRDITHERYELTMNMTYMWDNEGTNLSWVAGPLGIVENKIK